MAFMPNTEEYEEEPVRKILYRIEHKLDRLLQQDEVVTTGRTPNKETMKRFIKEMKEELSKRK